MEPLLPKIQRFNVLYVILAFWAMVFLYDFFNSKKNMEAIPYSQFLTYINENQISELTITSDQIKGQLKEAHQGQHPYFTTIRVDDPQLTNKLQEKKIKFHGTLQNDLWKSVTVGLALNSSEKIHKVSIIPRGIGSLGYTISRPLEDRYLMADFESQSFSEKTAQVIDEESNQLMEEAYALAVNALKKHQAFIEKGAEALLKKETLSEEDIGELWKQNEA